MRYLVIVLVIIIVSPLYSQNFGRGALLDLEKFDNSPKAPPLTRGDLKILPEKFSIKRFAPTPGDQGSSSTCTGWSSSYGARTMIGAINNNWDRNTINQNKFSPSYVYNQIRAEEHCDAGASIVDALELLKDQGALPYDDFGYDCERIIKNEDKVKASMFKVKEYREILDRFSKNKVLSIKKSLTQYYPVVIGINCPKSFSVVKDVWHPNKEDYVKVVPGHALTVVGYNNNIEGGAIEVLNSWGTNWANEGYAWIRYSDIDHFCVWGAEVIASKKKEYDNKLNAQIFLREYHRNIFRLQKKLSFYVTQDTFYTGTKFQLYVVNQEPSYLYIFSEDNQSGAEYIYPMNDLMSDYLAYSENNIILPAEDYAFELDENAGVSSFVILLSTESIKDDLYDFIKHQENGFNIDGLLNHLSKKNKKLSFNSTLNKENQIVIDEIDISDFISVVKIDISHSNLEVE